MHKHRNLHNLPLSHNFSSLLFSPPFILLLWPWYATNKLSSVISDFEGSLYFFCNYFFLIWEKGSFSISLWLMHQLGNGAVLKIMCHWLLLMSNHTFCALDKCKTASLSIINKFILLMWKCNVKGNISTCEVCYFGVFRKRAADKWREEDLVITEMVKNRRRDYKVLYTKEGMLLVWCVFVGINWENKLGNSKSLVNKCTKVWDIKPTHL